MHCWKNVERELITEPPVHVAVIGLLAWDIRNEVVQSVNESSSFVKRLVNPGNKLLPPDTTTLFVNVDCRLLSALQANNKIL